MDNTNIADLVSRLNLKCKEDVEHESLTAVKLSIAIFELADTLNSAINSVFVLAGGSLTRVMEDYQKNPTNSSFGLLNELHPLVERLEDLARARIEEVNPQEGS